MGSIKARRERHPRVADMLGRDILQLEVIAENMNNNAGKLFATGLHPALDIRPAGIHNDERA
jgi:hypothetical protein